MSGLLSGLVVAVSSAPVGTQTAAEVLSGSSVLLLDDTVNMVPSGGQVTIDGVVTAYVASDDDESTITLEVPLAATLAEGAEVLVYPPRVELTALVLIDGSSDPIPATVPWNMQDALPVGVREEEDREEVRLTRDGEWSWAVFDLPGVPLLRDGTYIDPVTLPPDQTAREAAQEALDAAHEAADFATTKNTVFYQTTMPTGGVEGDTWFDTDDGNRIYVHNGTTFVDARDTGIAAAASAASDAAALAELKTTIRYQNTAPTVGTGAVVSAFDTYTPPTTTSGSSYMRGNRLRLNVSGQITGLRYYRDAGGSPASSHVLRLYSGTGVLLASVTTSETGAPTGWFEATLPTPVTVSAGDEIVPTWDSTTTETVHYATTGFSSDASEITFLQGQYLLGTGGYPTTANPGVFYSIDVVFATVAGAAPTDMWVNTTGGANTPNRWNGSAWVAVTDKVATDAAALAGTKGTVYFQTTAPLSTLAQDLWIDTTGGANTPKRYVGGSWTAVTDKAATDAATLAATKGKVFFQDAEPATAERLSQNLWIDTTAGANTPKRWNGSAWVAVTDKVATTAQATANGKNTITHSTGTPGSTANTAGDVWFQKNGSNIIIGQWEGLGGTSWVAKTIDNAVIANLNVGKLVSGTLDTQTITLGNASTTGTIESYNYAAASVGVRIDKNGLTAKGGSITGALLQTESGANGIKMISSGMTAKDGAGNLKLSFTTTTGELLVNGPVVAGGSISGTVVTGSDGLQTTTAANRGIKMNSTALIAYDSVVGSPTLGQPTFSVSSATGAVAMKGDLISGSTITAATITGVLKTAASGRRVELSSTYQERIEFWGGQSGELAARIGVSNGANNGYLEILGPGMNSADIPHIILASNVGQTPSVRAIGNLAVTAGYALKTDKIESQTSGAPIQALGLIQAGNVSTGTMTAGTDKNLTVVFSPAFATTPIVTLGIKFGTTGSGGLNATVSGISTTGCTISAMRATGTTAFDVQWIATPATQ